MLERYVYIMGRGHSGSTVLDALLGNAENACGVGELVMGIDGTYPCSCGEKVTDCDFWQKVKDGFMQSTHGELPWDRAASILSEKSNVLQFIPTLLASSKSSHIQQLEAATQGVAEAVSKASHRPIVVDSSKEVSRGLLLARRMPESRILHIVRNPERMLASNLHRLRDGTGLVLFRRTFHSELFAPLIIAASALSWVVGNLLCEKVSRIAPDRVMRVRYEDLCEDPARVLRRISEFTGLHLDKVIPSVQNGSILAIQHKLAGNRMAKKGEFVFQPDRSSGRDIPRGLRRMGRVITYPLMKKYGYV